MKNAHLAAEATALLVDTLNSNGCDTDSPHGKARKENITRHLNTYSEATLQKILSLRDDANITLHCFTVENAMFNDVVDAEFFINDYLHLAHCFPAEDNGSRTADVVLALYSLDKYEGLTPIGPLFEYPQKRVEQCTAILTLVEHFEQIHNDGTIDEYPMDVEIFDSHMKYGSLSYIVEMTSSGFVRTIEDPTLRRLITAPDTDLNALTALVTERSIYRADEITELLDIQKGNRAAAISSGVL